MEEITPELQQQLNSMLKVNTNSMVELTLQNTLTKKESFASTALMGMLAHPASSEVDINGLIKTAYFIAEKMIEEGNKLTVESSLKNN